MSNPGPWGAPGLGFGGTMTAGCGSSGAAVATAGAAGCEGACSAAFGASAAAVAAGGAADAEDSEELPHALRPSAPQSAMITNAFWSKVWIMIFFYFTPGPKKKASTPAIRMTPPAVTTICVVSITNA